MKKAITPEERTHREIFRQFLRGEVRATTLTAGLQTPVYTSGSAGGMLVPQQFSEAVAEGAAAIDPLFDADVVSVHEEVDYSLRPLSIPGWDLSSIAAVRVDEASSENAGVIPVASSILTKNFPYRIALDATLEWDQDERAYGGAVAAFARAAGVGLARGISADLITGGGTTEPRGILIDATNSGVTAANTGKLVLEDFTNVFYSVNAAYRASDKCAWLVSDSVHKMIANCKDSSNRPLFPIVDGITYVEGKPVYISPSLPAYNASINPQNPGSFCVFGDLSQYHVHRSAVLMRRLKEAAGLIEDGKIRYHALQRVDAALHPASAGAVVYAKLKS